MTIKLNHQSINITVKNSEKITLYLKRAVYLVQYDSLLLITPISSTNLILYFINKPYKYSTGPIVPANIHIFLTNDTDLPETSGYFLRVHHV